MTYSERSRWASAQPGRTGVEHDLDDALPVAQVDEDDAAVVAAVGHPAAQGDLGPFVAGPETAGVMGSHAHRPRSRWVVPRCSWSQETTRLRGTSTCSPDSMSRTATAPFSISARPKRTT